MADFNGRKLFGYCMDNDPDLAGASWNTNNFEFTCIRPETVQRAIDKVSSDAGGSLKQKKSNLLNQLREKCGDAEINENQSCTNRDNDTETSLSQTQCYSHKFDSGHARAKEIINKEKYFSEESSPSPSVNDITITGDKSYDRAKAGQCQNIKKMQKAVLEECDGPQPAWVEITEPRTANMQMFDLKQPPPPPLPPSFGYPPSLFQLPTYQFASQAMQNLAFMYNQPPVMETFPYQNPYGDYNPNAFLNEDSDLEDEMMRRAHYTKFCGKRPEVNDAGPTEDNESCAEFINVAPQEPYIDMSCLKSTAPMRYSELSDDEDGKNGMQQQEPKVIIKNRKKSETGYKNSAKQTQNKSKKEPKKEKVTKTKPSPFARLLEQERMIINQQSKGVKTFVKRPVKRNISSPTRLSHQLSTQRTTQESTANDSEYRSTSKHGNGKSIEQLKAEKIAIFCKMSRTHERLIDALQQLRAKLLEVYVPESISDRQRRNRNGFEFSVRFLRNFLYPLKGMIDTAKNTPKELYNSIRSNDACNRISHIFSLFLQAVLTYSKQIRHFMLDQVPQKLTTLLEMLYNTINMCLEKRLFDRNDTILECLMNHCGHFLSFLEDLHAQRYIAAREKTNKTTDERQTAKYDLKMFMNGLNMYEPKVVPKRPTVSARPRPVSVRRSAPNTAYSDSTNGASQVNNMQRSPQHIRKRNKTRKALKNRQHEKPNAAVYNRSEPDDEPKRTEIDVPTQVQNWKPHSSDLDLQESSEVLQDLQNCLKNAPNLGKYKKIDNINRSILNALNKKNAQPTRDVLQPLLKTIDDVLDMEEDGNETEKILRAFQIKILRLLNERKFRCEDKALRNIQSEISEIYYSSQNEQNLSSDELEGQSDNNIHQSGSNRSYMKSNTTFYDNSDDNDCENEDEEEEEEIDKDGQFYISGVNYSEKPQRKSIRSTRSQKSKLEPLIEIVDKCDADELYWSDTENQAPRGISSILDQIKLNKPLSPYVVPLSRRSNKAEKLSKGTASKKGKNNSKETNNSQTLLSGKKTTSTTTTTTSKNKTNVVPPSPAQAKLKQHGQTLLTERSKKNNLLRKRSHRNPMGTPPPVPTVSPSTSVALAASKVSLSNPLNLPKVFNGSVPKKESCTEIYHHNIPTFENQSSLNAHLKAKSPSSSPSLQSFSKTTHVVERKDDKSKDIRAIDNEKEGTQGDTVQEKPGAKSQVPSLIVKIPSMGGHGDGDNKMRENLKPQNFGCGDQKDNNAIDFEKTLYKNEIKSNETSSKVEFDETPLLRERDEYLSLCIRNRLYTNPNFASPWKVLSRLSNQLTRDIIKDVEADFDAGVLNFVDDFLDMETRIGTK